MKFDGNNLSIDEIRALVELGDNPTEREMASVGLKSNSDGSWAIIDAELFEKARRQRTLRFDSSDVRVLINRRKR